MNKNHTCTFNKFKQFIYIVARIPWHKLPLIQGAQSDVRNREDYHENKAVCGKTLMTSQKLKGESTRNILLNKAV